jgi:hypothetical protein
LKYKIQLKLSDNLAKLNDYLNVSEDRRVIENQYYDPTHFIISSNFQQEVQNNLARQNKYEYKYARIQFNYCWEEMHKVKWDDVDRKYLFFYEASALALSIYSLNNSTVNAFDDVTLQKNIYIIR